MPEIEFAKGRVIVKSKGPMDVTIISTEGGGLKLVFPDNNHQTTVIDESANAVHVLPPIHDLRTPPVSARAPTVTLPTIQASTPAQQSLLPSATPRLSLPMIVSTPPVSARCGSVTDEPPKLIMFLHQGKMITPDSNRKSFIDYYALTRNVELAKQNILISESIAIITPEIKKQFTKKKWSIIGSINYRIDPTRSKEASKKSKEKKRLAQLEAQEHAAEAQEHAAEAQEHAAEAHEQTAEAHEEEEEEADA